MLKILKSKSYYSITLVLGIVLIFLSLTRLEQKIERDREQIKMLVEQNRLLSNDNVELQNKINELQAVREEKNKLIVEQKERIKELEERKKTPSVSRGMGVNNTKKKKKSIGTFEVTAYDDSPQSQGKWVGKTATGMKPQVGVVAVDPKVIPLHTKLYVEGYGECIAGDTGGAIKGRRIDVFLNTKEEVQNWGRKKNVKVYIIE